MNSRLDTLQAAILQPKFKAFKEYEVDAVNKSAEKYTELLADSGLVTPYIPDGYISSWAQYTVQLPDSIDRAKLIDHLKENSIPSMVYYAKPMHQQGAFEGTRSAVADCKATENLCKTVLSLPMHPYLIDEDIKNVIYSVIKGIQ